MKPRLLDLFCGAGGASMGYHRAGFDVVGVDIRPQPRYPFEFHQADALTFPLEGFDAIHASPPCQKFTVLRARWKRDYPDLIEPIRDRLSAAGAPWVIENVGGAPLLGGGGVIRLCGSMFGLTTATGEAELRRHRDFECSFPVVLRPHCNHGSVVVTVTGHAGGTRNRDGRKQFRADARREAMGIDWMTNDELAQAIPPAYTEWIGRRLLETVGGQP